MFDLIDTLWNVKRIFCYLILICGDDLIDTLWNVKLCLPYSTFVDVVDLIDTLWNVKLLSFNHMYSVWIRFNRYIVECKVFS